MKVFVGFKEGGFFTLLITKVTSESVISELKHPVICKVLTTVSLTEHVPDEKLAEESAEFYGEVVSGKIIYIDPPAGIGSFNLTVNVYEVTA